MKVSQANRGQGFEQLLNITNLQYERANIALIHKRPTPMKVLRPQGMHFLSVFECKSTVDFDGVYQGRAIYFEAKSTREESRFDLKLIESHQLEHLEKAESIGGICFFLIEFAKSHEVFLVPLSTMRHYILRARNGSRKSIPREDFEYCAYVVEKTKRAALDYLVHVDKLIGEGVA